MCLNVYIFVLIVLAFGFRKLFRCYFVAKFHFLYFGFFFRTIFHPFLSIGIPFIAEFRMNCVEVCSRGAMGWCALSVGEFGRLILCSQYNRNETIFNSIWFLFISIQLFSTHFLAGNKKSFILKMNCAIKGKYVIFVLYMKFGMYTTAATLSLSFAQMSIFMYIFRWAFLSKTNVSIGIASIYYAEIYWLVLVKYRVHANEPAKQQKETKNNSNFVLLPKIAPEFHFRCTLF